MEVGSLAALVRLSPAFASPVLPARQRDASWGRSLALRPNRALVVAALLWMAAVACLHGCGNETGSPSTTGTDSTPTSKNPVYGLNFGPYVGAGQAAGSAVSSAQIASLLTGVRAYTQWVRTFGVESGLETVPPMARQMGFKTAIGAYIGSDTIVNNREIASLVAAAKAGSVDIAIVGNEVLLNNLRSEDQLIGYIQSVRSQVPASVQVTSVDAWSTMVAHPKVIAAVDVVGVNIYPFYEDVPIAQGLSALQADYAATVQAANGKPVIITETGWPSGGSPPASSPAAVPSSANAAAYFGAVETWARGSNIALFYFEAYDEAWKANYGDYPSWGIWDASGTMKTGMAAVFQK